MKTRLAIVVLMLAVLSVFAVADNNTAKTQKDTSQGQEFTARYDHLACSVDMVTTMIDSVTANVAQSSDNLSGASDKLKADLATLKGYADAKNKTNFNTFVTGTLKDDMKAYQDALKSVRDKFKDYNLTNETRNLLKTEKAAAIDEYKTCNSQSERSIVNAKNNVLETQISQWNRDIADFKSKNLDTTAMEAVVSDASQLTTLLNEASSASSDNETKAKLEEARQLNLHLEARFAIAKINAQLSKIEANATALNLTDKIEQIKNLLSNASTMAVSGEPYAEGEFEKTWNDIKSANEILKSFVNDFKTKRKAFLAQMRDQRQQAKGEMKQQRNLTKGNNSENRTIGKGINKSNREQPFPQGRGFNRSMRGPLQMPVNNTNENGG